MSEAQNFSTGQMAIDAELVTGILQRSLRNGTIVGAAAIGAFAMFSASRFGIEPDSTLRGFAHLFATGCLDERRC